MRDYALKLATLDSLTGTIGRKTAKERVNLEISRSIIRNCNFSILMFDIDFFKKYNDRAGHVAGDATLKELIKRIKKHVRKHDILIRLGGEEFCVLLPFSSFDVSYAIARKLCLISRGLNVCKSKDQPYGYVSISIGLLTYAGHSSNNKKNYSSDSLLKAVDDVLYRAKNLGGDRVEF